jgi:hypothetical protein
VFLGFADLYSAGLTHMGISLVSERDILTFLTLFLGGRIESRSERTTLTVLETVSSLQHGVMLQSTNHRLDRWACGHGPFLLLLFVYFSHGMTLSPLGTAATVWSIVPAPDDR